ncbi:peptide/nickel transport system permease protein [Actinokineospora alba]|uniref:Peptide/nickel transport system permease protein n=1 Tax=Actinokineospora alba TaxID=504798 RepID=A0A1H0EMZ5_9PSEU|nr:ABC transporter permease [Actinokineospora alba]TDP69145.1 peptide/nickel transport system permease protein [Actinokineospora alba]SDI23340.1 peptide/nickel transport system permease protein [Actinokineospora alba]SDN83720.1 peptide/nickel transport system permease protein [Actinokineospora alba]
MTVVDDDQDTRARAPAVVAARKREWPQGRMGGRLVIRLSGWLALCVAATFLTYAVASLSFDPLAELRSTQPPTPQAVLDARASALGLDQPIPLRFLGWLSGAVTGDFGVTVAGNDIADEVWRRAGTSLRLFVPGSVLAVVFGIAFGIWGAVRAGRISDRVSMVTSLVLLAIPVFVLGTVLKLLWLPVNDAAGTDLLPFSGETTPGADLSGWAAFGDRVRHLVLPTITIALPQIAFYSRYQRAAMLEVLHSDFLRAARAKGLRRGQAVLWHGLRMALIPMTALVAFSFGLHLAGGVFTERIFGWHGLGDWMLASIHDQDAMVVATTTLLMAVLVVVVGWIADLALVLLDPRVRGGRS